jgi:hypothetical protein
MVEGEDERLVEELVGELAELAKVRLDGPETAPREPGEGAVH